MFVAVSNSLAQRNGCERIVYGIFMLIVLYHFVKRKRKKALEPVCRRYANSIPSNTTSNQERCRHEKFKRCARCILSGQRSYFYYTFYTFYECCRDGNVCPMTKSRLRLMVNRTHKHKHTEQRAAVFKTYCIRYISMGGPCASDGRSQ